MKALPLKSFFLFSLLLCVVYGDAQDTIMLHDGNKIVSKVFEITPDWVKYKKWEYQTGPTYYLDRSDVALIKYPNDTFDKFEIPNNPTITNKTEAAAPDSAIDKFAGEWFPTTYDAINCQTKLTITKTANDYLIFYSVYEKNDSTINTRGSFKEVGQLNGNTIAVNSNTKITMIDNLYLLMCNTDFYQKTGLITSINQLIDCYNDSINIVQKEIVANKLEIDKLGKEMRTNSSTNIPQTTNKIRTLTKNAEDHDKQIKGFKAKIAVLQKKIETLTAEK